MSGGEAQVTAGVLAGTGITAETAVGNTPISSATAEGGQGNYISGSVQIPNVAAAAVVTVKVRQGLGTGGTVVGTAGPYTVGTAAVGAAIPFAFLDQTAAAAGVSQYTVTVTSTTSTGAGVTGAVAVQPTGVDY